MRNQDESVGQRDEHIAQRLRQRRWWRHLRILNVGAQPLERMQGRKQTHEKVLVIVFESAKTDRDRVVVAQDEQRGISCRRGAVCLRRHDVCETTSSTTVVYF